jgi:hypothetical protein
LRLKLVRRGNEGYFILIMGTIHQELIKVLNIYVPNSVAPNYIEKKKTLLDLKTHTELNTIIV